CSTRSWFRPATASGSNWIEPSRWKTSRTASGPPRSDRAGARKCRATRKRRAASAVIFTWLDANEDGRRKNGHVLAPPPPDAPLPSTPALVAKSLAQTDADLRTAIAAWSPKSAPAPRAVVLDALYEQRLYRLLARNAKLADATLPALPPR